MLKKGNFRGARPLFVLIVVDDSWFKKDKQDFVAKEIIGLRFVDNFRTSNDIWWGEKEDQKLSAAWC